jgi:hypothetical protein
VGSRARRDDRSRPALLNRLGRHSYWGGMACELDDIIVLTDCLNCGTELRVPYKQLRLHRAAGCSCGALIRLEDEPRVTAIETLIDEASTAAPETADTAAGR